MNNALELADALADALRNRGYAADAAYAEDTVTALKALRDLKAAIHDSSVGYIEMGKVTSAAKQSLARLNAS